MAAPDFIAPVPLRRRSSGEAVGTPVRFDDGIQVAAPEDDFSAPIDLDAVERKRQEKLRLAQAGVRGRSKVFDPNASADEVLGAVLQDSAQSRAVTANINAEYDDRKAAIERKIAERKQKETRARENSEREAKFRAAGAEFYTDAEGLIQPVIDPGTGKPRFKTDTSEVRYTADGAPYQVKRDETGAITVDNPDKNAPIAKDPSSLTDSNLYRQTEHQPWQTIDPSEGVNSTDPKTRVASIKELHRRAVDDVDTRLSRARLELENPDRPKALTKKERADAETQIATLKDSTSPEDVKLFQQAQAALASDEDRKKLQREVYDLEKEKAGMGKPGVWWEERGKKERARLVDLPAEDFQKEADAQVADADATVGSVATERAKIQGRVTEINAALQRGVNSARAGELMAEREQLVARDGELVGRHNDAAARVRNLQAVQNDRVEKQKAAVKASRDEMRKQPGMAGIADKLDALDAEAESRRAELDGDSFPDDATAKTAREALEADLSKKARGLAREMADAESEIKMAPVAAVAKHFDGVDDPNQILETLKSGKGLETFPPEAVESYKKGFARELVPVMRNLLDDFASSDAEIEKRVWDEPNLGDHLRQAKSALATGTAQTFTGMAAGLIQSLHLGESRKKMRNEVRKTIGDLQNPNRGEVRIFGIPIGVGRGSMKVDNWGDFSDLKDVDPKKLSDEQVDEIAARLTVLYDQNGTDAYNRAPHELVSIGGGITQLAREKGLVDQLHGLQKTIQTGAPTDPRMHWGTAALYSGAGQMPANLATAPFAGANAVANFAQMYDEDSGNILESLKKQKFAAVQKSGSAPKDINTWWESLKPAERDQLKEEAGVKAIASALPNAALETLADKLLVGKLPLPAKIKKAILAWRKASPSIAFGARVGAGVLGRLLTEGSTEAGQQLISNAVRKVATGDDESVLKGVGESFVGGLGGAGVAAPLSVRESIDDVREADAAEALRGRFAAPADFHAEKLAPAAAQIDRIREIPDIESLREQRASLPPDQSAAVDAEIAVRARVEPVKVPSEARADLATGLVKVAMGSPMDSIPAAERTLLESAKTAAGVSFVEDVNGTPVITDIAREWLRSVAPAADSLISMDEAGARGFAAAKADSAKSAQETPQSQPQKAPQEGSRKSAASKSSTTEVQWVARGQNGTEVTISSAEASSQADAEQKLAEKLPTGEMLDPDSIERKEFSSGRGVSEKVTPTGESQAGQTVKSSGSYPEGEGSTPSPATNRDRWLKTSAPKRTRIISKVLQNRGVAVETADAFARQWDESHAEDNRGMDAVRQAVLEDFRAAGGRFQGEGAAANYSVDPNFYKSGGQTDEEAAESVRNAQAQRANDDAAVSAANTALGERILNDRPTEKTEETDTASESQSEKPASEVTERQVDSAVYDDAESAAKKLKVPAQQVRDGLARARAAGLDKSGEILKEILNPGSGKKSSSAIDPKVVRAIVALPENQRQRAVGLLDRFSDSLRRFMPAFDSVEIVAGSLGGAGAVLHPAGNKLRLSLSDIETWSEDQMADGLTAVLAEESVHRVTVDMEKAGEFDPVEFWNTLPEPIRKLVDSTLRKNAGVVQSGDWARGHEAVRILLQADTAEFNNAVTEAQGVNPNWAADWREFLTKLVSRLQDELAKLRKSTSPEREAIEQALSMARARLRELGILEKSVSKPDAAPSGMDNGRISGSDEQVRDGDVSDRSGNLVESGESNDGINESVVLPQSEAGGTAPVPVGEGTSKDLPAPQFAQQGDVGTAYTDNNDAIEYRWAVAEISDLIISNEDDGRINPKYPQELQPRDRTTAGSQQQVENIAKNANFDRLSFSESVGNGAPIVGPEDGVAESGNGRLMGLRRAYAQKLPSIKAYRESLEANAAKFGLDGTTIATMKQPVLVRVRQTIVDRKKFAEMANVSNLAPMREMEIARKDAGNLAPGLFENFAPSEDGDIFAASNMPFLNAVIRTVVPKGEWPAVMDSKGALSQSGLRRVRNALFVYAYGDKPEAMSALGRITEMIDADGRNLTNALLAVAPTFARQASKISDGALHDLLITGDLVAAVQALTEIRARGETVSQYLEQGQLIKDRITPLQKRMLQFLDRNARSAKRITEALRRYAAALEMAGDPRQMGFLDTETPTKESLWNLAEQPTPETTLSSGDRRMDQVGWLRVYNKLFSRQQSGDKLTPEQQLLLNRAERELGQRLMFTDEGEGIGEKYSGTEEQLKLFSSARRAQSILDRWHGEDQRFAIDVDLALDKGGFTRSLVLGETPEVLRRLGAVNLNLTMRADDLAKVVGKSRSGHEITRDQVKQLPEKLREPLLVLESSTQPNSFVVITDLEEKGKPVIAAIHLNRREGRIFVNRVASVYGKDRLDFYRPELVRYVEKKRGLQWLQSAGLQLPMEGGIANLGKNVLTEDDVVNRDSRLREIASGETLSSSSRDDGQGTFNFESDQPEKNPGELVKENLGLATSIASGYFGIPGVQNDDVVQTARQALVTAAQKFPARENKSVPFINYAGSSIRNRLNDLYGKQMRVARAEETSLDEPLPSGDGSRVDLVEGKEQGRALPVEQVETRAIVDEVIASLPERSQAIVRGFMADRSGEEMAQEFNLTRQRVNEILRTSIAVLRQRLRARGFAGQEDGVLFSGARDELPDLFRELQADMPSVDEIETLRQQANGEPVGERTIGQPEKAKYSSDDETRRATDVIQQIRENEMRRETERQWIEEGRRMLRDDRAGVMRLLLNKALNPEKFGTFTAPEVKAAQILVPELMKEAFKTGNAALRQRAFTLAWAYDAGGSAQARAFAARRDPFKTRAERHSEFLTKMVSTPSAEKRKWIESAPDAHEKHKRLVEAQNERLERIEKALAEMGVTLEDVFSGEAYLRLKGAKMVENALDGYDAKKKKAIRLIQDQFPDSEIARVTGLNVEQVQRLEAEIMDKLSARLDQLGDAALDVANFDIDTLASSAKPAIGETLTKAEREKRKQEILRAMGFGRSRERNSKKLVKRRKPRRRPPVESFAGPSPSDDPVEAERLTQVGLEWDENRRAWNRNPQAAKDGAVPAEKVKQEKIQYDIDQPWEYVKFDPGNLDQVVRLARIVQATGLTPEERAFDMFYEYWVNSILSGPQTHFVNIMGNGGMAAWEYLVQRPMEAAVNLIARDESSATFGEMRHLYRGMMPGIMNGWKAGVRAFQAEHDFFESEKLNDQVTFAGYDKLGDIKASIPGTVGRVIRVPGRALMFMDSFFKFATGQMEAGAQAYRIGKVKGLSGDVLEDFVKGQLNHPGSMAWQAAVQKAKDLTFQTELPQLLKDFSKLRSGRSATSLGGRLLGLFLGMTFPFIRTPYNIFRVGLRKSPLGAINVARHVLQGLYSMKNGRPFIEGYSKAQLVQDMSEQFLAWGAVALLLSAIEGDDDDKDKWFLITGSRPYGVDKQGERDLLNRMAGGAFQVRLGGRNGLYFDYGRYEPFATVVGTMADMVRLGKTENPPDWVFKMMANLAAQAENKTFLPGVRSIMDTIDAIKGHEPERMGRQWGKQFLSGLVPNIVRQPIRNWDDAIRDSKYAGMLYSLTGLPTAAEKRFDLYGQPVEKQGSGLSRLLFAAGVVPSPILEKGDEFLTAYNRDAEKPYWPERYSSYKLKNAKGENVGMTPEQIADFDRRSGIRFAQKLKTWLTPSVIKNPTEEHMDRFQKDLKDARKEIKATFRPRQFSN